jgi:hypothetical protein
MRIAFFYRYQGNELLSGRFPSVDQAKHYIAWSGVKATRIVRRRIFGLGWATVERIAL